MEGFNWTEWTLFATESGNGEYYERYSQDPVTVNGIERFLNFNYWKFQPDRSVFDLWEKCQEYVYIDSYETYTEAYELLHSQTPILE